MFCLCLLKKMNCSSFRQTSLVLNHSICSIGSKHSKCQARSSVRAEDTTTMKVSGREKEFPGECTRATCSQRHLGKKRGEREEEGWRE